MQPGDPRFASFPSARGAAQLRWYIRQTADGILSVEDLLADFRALHENIEKKGPAQFASDDEARAVWDVLWAVEFCSLNNPPAAGSEADPGPRSDAERGRGRGWDSKPGGGETHDLHSPEEVLVIVKRAATRLTP